ncbi:hypothetical protein HOB87_07610 [Candidatus Woesearchaeota archaeon]|jgi:hypothetical protein|nr:hypothetical protein [Candidatus Woesearchaeota archaeon]MBT7555584.1 hypothetical protein [Candidatus Woesearchaeota archaeon]
MEVNQCALERKKSLVFLYSVFSYLVALFFIGFIIYKYHNLNTLDIVEVIKSTYILDVHEFKPEPFEWIIYTLGLVFFPILILPLHFVLNSYASLFKSQYVYNISWLLVFMTPVIVLFYASTQEWGSWYYKFFLEKTVFSVNSIVPFFLLTLMATLIYFDKLKLPSVVRNTLLKAMSVILSAVTLYYLILSFFINIFDVNSSEWGWTHFDAIYYSVVQVVNDNSALYVDGFSNTYGLYPHLLEPILSLTGGVSIFKFTLIQAALIFISFWIIYYVINKLVANRIIANIGFLSVIWAQYFYGKFAAMYLHRQMEYYFQYTPLRTIFPCLILYLAYKYTTKKSNFIRLLGYVVSAISLIWNIETGAIVSISWYMFILYSNIDHDGGAKFNLIKSFNEFLVFFGVIAAIIVFYYIYIYTRYGEPPQLQLSFQTIKTFGSHGYFMINIPVIGPWNLLILIYISAFFYALLNIKKKAMYQFNSVMFLLSTMGFGLFYYYLGRSANGNIFFVSWPGFILLTMYVNALHIKMKNKKALIHQKVLFISIMTVFLASTVNMIYYAPGAINKLIINRNKVFDLRENTVVKSNIEFIKKNTKPYENILILSGRQGVYHSETTTSSSFNIGLRDLFYKKDYDKLIELISSKNIKIFLDEDTFKNDPGQSVYNYNNAHIISVIESKYSLVGSYRNMMYFLKSN